MGRPHAVPGETAELCRINVAKNDADRLAWLANQTGSAQSWHRRKALTEYLDRNVPRNAELMKGDQALLDTMAAHASAGTGRNLLAWKTAAVMGEVHRVRKSGRNSQQGYDFAKEGDIADMVRVLLAKYRVGFAGSLISVQRSEIKSKAGNAGTEALVRMQMTLTCADTGEVEETYWEGDATDYTDKAVPKAITACKKSWLIFRFLISTGEEDEPDSGGQEYTRGGYQQTSAPRSQQSGPDTRKVTTGQVSRLHALARNVPFLYVAGEMQREAMHDLARWVLRKDANPNPVESFNDLTRDEVQRIFVTLEKCADPEVAGQVAAAIDEWLTSMGPGDAVPASAPDPASDDEPAPFDEGYPG